ncbi:MAG TPA: NAD-dependent epimerase/dehydratase family protein, partial [Burkholderiales bacterium]|nr:NAD-dependent epimerase/dehydratase family protein [Burkholderiales bacterium]
MSTKTAVVVGALGVIGRYIVDKLASLPDWQVIGLSRRTGEPRERVRYVPVDLLDRQDVEAKLAGLKEATHVFYAALHVAKDAGPNLAANVA